MAAVGKIQNLARKCVIILEKKEKTIHLGVKWGLCNKTIQNVANTGPGNGLPGRKRKYLVYETSSIVWERLTTLRFNIESDSP